jgi:hypothetical protein
MVLQPLIDTLLMEFMIAGIQFCEVSQQNLLCTNGTLFSDGCGILSSLDAQCVVIQCHVFARVSHLNVKKVNIVVTIVRGYDVTHDSVDQRVTSDIQKDSNIDCE